MLPGLVSLLDDMQMLDLPLTAPVALARYQDICKNLPDTVLNRPVQAVSYNHGMLLALPLIAQDSCCTTYLQANLGIATVIL